MQVTQAAQKLHDISSELSKQDNEAARGLARLLEMISVPCMKGDKETEELVKYFMNLVLSNIVATEGIDNLMKNIEKHAKNARIEKSKR